MAGLHQARAMFGIDVYALALFGIIVAWIILTYLAFPIHGRTSSAPEPRRFYRGTFGVEKDLSPDLRDVGEQLHAVMAASFEKRRLLSASEYHAFKIIESDVAAARRGYRVFAQTSLGEVLATPRDENGFRSVVNNNGFRSINSKRVDILIIDQGGWPVVAVEYQGEGHYQGTAAARDAVKKEALKAGVRYVEVFPGDSAEQIRSRVRGQLGWTTAKPTSCDVLRIA
jgi:hypothetical protein